MTDWEEKRIEKIVTTLPKNGVADIAGRYGEHVQTCLERPARTQPLDRVRPRPPHRAPQRPVKGWKRNLRIIVAGV